MGMKLFQMRPKLQGETFGLYRLMFRIKIIELSSLFHSQKCLMLVTLIKYTFMSFLNQLSLEKCNFLRHTRMKYLSNEVTQIYLR